MNNQHEENYMDSALKDSFLTAEYKKEHAFTLSHASNANDRKVFCEETMHESKLCMGLPYDLIRTFRQFAINMRNVFQQKFCHMQNDALVKTYLELMKQLDSNIVVYTQMVDYLDNYAGPSFKPSRDKFRLESAVVPINLHVQRLKIKPDDISWSCITCGAVTGAALRKRHSSLYKLRKTLNTNFDYLGKNYTKEALFYTRQKTLKDAKATIMTLTRKINNEQNVDFNLLSEAKQLHQLLLDLIQSFPNVRDLVDALCLNGLAQMSKPLIGKTLSNQLKLLEAAFTELDTKAVNKVNDDQTVKDLLNALLDMLRNLINSIYYAQFMGLIIASRNPTDIQIYFQLQLRYDIVMAQAITIISTCLLNNIDLSTKEELESWTKYGPFVSFYGLLTCITDEKSMVEDMREIWSPEVFHDNVRFRFTSSTSPNMCTPEISGCGNADIEVTIPLTSEALEKLPTAYANGDWFRVRTAYWNVTVNQESTVEAKGDLDFEKSVNRDALAAISNIVFESPKEKNKKLVDLFNELKKVVDKYPSRNVILMLRSVQTITRALNGSSIIACKSGKDRTSMALTFECGVFLKKHLDCSQQDMEEIIVGLRKKGVRRENCRKNIGTNMFYCSPKQLSCMPKEFRPPAGTYSHSVSS